MRFEPVSSAIMVQRSNQLSYKAQLGEQIILVGQPFLFRLLRYSNL